MATWGTRRTVDLLRRLTGAYYRRKYGALAHRMGRPGVSPDGRRGFIVIQIDGLAHEHLLEALRGNHLPWLGRMMNEGHLSLAPWHCGLPSTTPAAQAGIMFGNREDVPGFRWYEKERGLAVVAKRPDQIQALQARLKGRRIGILRGGSSYVNMFDGDADLALFTLAALHPQRFFESVRGIGLLLLFLLSPFRVLRVLGLTTLGYVQAVGWRLAALARRSVIKPYDLLSPLLTSAVDSLFTEVQTFGVILDIYRSVSSIYANYNTYDEVAHVVGPTHRAALAVLRDVDRRIRQIDRMRNRYQSRQYDLYVLSDHGNTPSVPFSWVTEQSLGQFILAQLGQEISLGEVFGRAGYALTKARYLLEEIRGLEEQVPPALRRVLTVLRRYVDRRVPADPEREVYDLERREDVVVRVSGPLAHVYFNVASRQLDLVEVGLLYPQLLNRLAMTPSIGLVVGRAGRRTVVLGPEGGSAVISEGTLELEFPDPLAAYGDHERVAREIHRLAALQHSGDLILMGGIQTDGRAVTFEEQVATHGGIGGVQEWPFIAYPPSVPLGTVEAPQDLYRLFWDRYLDATAQVIHPDSGQQTARSVAGPPRQK
jgi:hypothetical protein